nr:M28 family peptidase [Gemmatimonadales bacterium]
HDRRSFMFHAYGAEELGLIGSQCFCDNPTVPLERVTAMVNFDMVGRLRYEELYLGGLWTSTQWRDELLRYNFDALTLIDFQTCQSCSDHACFRWNNRPSIWFFTGDHPQYHTPADDVALINGPGLVQVGTLALNTLVHLSVRPDEMPFDSPLPAPIAGAEGR